MNKLIIYDLVEYDLITKLTDDPFLPSENREKFLVDVNSKIIKKKEIQNRIKNTYGKIYEFKKFFKNFYEIIFYIDNNLIFNKRIPNIKIYKYNIKNFYIEKIETSKNVILYNINSKFI
jgi:hypothetical protein